MHFLGIYYVRYILWRILLEFQSQKVLKSISSRNLHSPGRDICDHLVQPFHETREETNQGK